MEPPLVSDLSLLLFSDLRLRLVDSAGRIAPEYKLLIIRTSLPPPLEDKSLLVGDALPPPLEDKALLFAETLPPPLRLDAIDGIRRIAIEGDSLSGEES